MLKLYVLIILGGVLPISSAYGEENKSFPEPFGLSWDMSSEELKKYGFVKKNSSTDFDIYSSYRAPKSWSQAESYVALTYNDKLVKVVANTRKFSKDIYGSKGKSVYKSVNELLVNKYGEPDSVSEVVGNKLYDEKDEFYQCLKYSGCGYFFSSYSVGGGSIFVQLEGVRRGEGFLSITYESPYFIHALEDIKAKDFESDSNAL